MADQNFKNPDGKGDVTLKECKLTKSINDYDSRSERIPDAVSYTHLTLPTTPYV